MLLTTRVSTEYSPLHSCNIWQRSPQRKSERLHVSCCPALSLSVLFTPAQFSDKNCQNNFLRFLKRDCVLHLLSYKKKTCVFWSAHFKLVYRTGITEHFLFESDFELCQDTPAQFSGNLWATVSLWQLLKLGESPGGDLQENRSVLTTQSPLQPLISWTNVTHQSLASEWAW